MRIVSIAAGSGHMYCGSCLRDGALATALIAKGHDVTLVPTYTPLRIESPATPVDQVFFGGLNVYLQHKLPLFRKTPRFLDRLLDSKRLLNFVAGFGHMTAARDLAELTIAVLDGEEGSTLKEITRLTDWLASEPRPDIVVLPNSLVSGLAAPIRRRLDVPVVCQLAGEDMFVNDFPEPWRGRTLEALRSRVVDCDAFIAPNEYYADFMAEWLRVDRRRIHVSLLGVDKRDFPETRPPEPDTFTIGFLARVCPHKGLDVLAEAFRILKSRDDLPDCRLRVAGHLAVEFRPYLAEIEKRIESWGLSGSYDYVGEIDRAAKVDFLSRLNAFVAPSVYPEPKGTPVAEALAAGTPVVAADAGCFPEWIEATRGGLLFEPSDANSLADALARLMTDSVAAKRLGDTGQRAVRERFNVDAMAEAALSVFEDVIAFSLAAGESPIDIADNTD